MLNKVKKFLVNISGVAAIEFAIVTIVLILFAAASVDVYSTFNIKSKAQDVVQNIALGVSKTDLSQVTIDDAVGRVGNMLAPYNVPNNAFLFDLHTTRFEDGAFLAPVTGADGGLTGAPAFAPCTIADLNLPATLSDGYADIISARLCINAETVQPTIFGNLLAGIFTKDVAMCQRVCSLGQNTLKNNANVRIESTVMTGFVSESLDSIHDPEPDPEAYHTDLACRLVVTDIPRYGPCLPTDLMCDESAFNYTPTSFAGSNILANRPPNASGAGACRDPITGVDLVGRSIVVPNTAGRVRNDVTIEIFNTCNVARNHNAIERSYAGADDTREPIGTGAAWEVYETQCVGMVCNCALVGTEGWTPKGHCAEWRIVDTGRGDLRDNGVYYTDDVCPHPKSTNRSGFGNQDACTKVLVPAVDPATGTMAATCNMSHDFVLHNDNTRFGMMQWNRMRREMYHYASHRHGFDNGTGMQYFYDGYQTDVHGGSLESVWAHKTTGDIGPRPPDGEHPRGGSNPIEGNDNHDRYKGNPYEDGGIDMTPCPGACE